MKKNSRILVTGATGMIGKALCKKLSKAGYTYYSTFSSRRQDLRYVGQTVKIFEAIKPEYVFHLAAKVGGILANDTYPADFLRDNININTNVLDAAQNTGVKRLLFAGSGCVYPRDCPQPIKEEYLLTGLLEKTNEAYAIAKIAGIKLCDAYRRQCGCNFFSVMPCNVYGPHDNFNLENAHVVPALIRKFYEARSYKEESVTAWGDGTARREFIHVDDLAAAMLFLMEQPQVPSLINIGSGEETTIHDLVSHIAGVAGYAGHIAFDGIKGINGTPRKLLDSSKLNALGFKCAHNLNDGLRETYEWFATNHDTARL